MDCRLINPAKNHIGTISKHILDNINGQIRKVTRSNQWKNTTEALEWFTNIPSKSSKSFLQFDIVQFYPSISEKLLSDSLIWAGTMVNISKEEMETIMHCRKTFLYYNQNAWVKKENSDFDVSMGSLDSAEVCELVGLFLLNKIEGLIPRQDVGLYRDDGLAVTSLPGPDIERLNKSLKKLFKTHGLTIEIQSGMKTTNFLDVTLYLDSSTFRPYRKDNKPPIYIKNSSNHPPHIKKELPRMISKRITQISSNKEIFKEEAPVDNTALENSGFSQKLQYSEEPVHQGAKNRRRKREVLWFNPPWNDAVASIY